MESHYIDRTLAGLVCVESNGNLMWTLFCWECFILLALLRPSVVVCYSIEITGYV